MQAPNLPPLRHHWMPVHPSWAIAAILVLLAALPHQIPVFIRYPLHTVVGAVVFAAVSVAVGMKVPVLGMALLIFLTGIWSHAPPLNGAELFSAPVLNKDKIRHGTHLWLSEEVMHKQPVAIQERTKGAALTIDEVPDHEQQWAVESALDEHPEAIQERPVTSTFEYDEPSSSGRR